MTDDAVSEDVVLLPVPPEINGTQLGAELAAAGFPEAHVVVVGDKIEVYGVGLDVGPEDEAATAAITAAVAAVVDAHHPTSNPYPPLGPFGDLLTLLALYEGQVLPAASELAAMGGFTEAQLANNFHGWMLCGGLV